MDKVQDSSRPQKNDDVISSFLRKMKFAGDTAILRKLQHKKQPQFQTSVTYICSYTQNLNPLFIFLFSFFILYFTFFALKKMKKAKFLETEF